MPVYHPVPKKQRGDAVAWSDYQKLYKDIMLTIFLVDKQGAEVCKSMIKLERKVAELKDRKHTETDVDFIELTQKKLDKANADLENMVGEFEGGSAAKVTSYFNDLNSTHGGPFFDLKCAIQEGLT